MPLPNHNNADLTIYQMVRNRLPFVADTVGNQATLSAFTLEVMWELEPCFEVRNYSGTEDLAKVGDENYYTQPQRNVIADIVAVYVLQLTAAQNVQGGAISNTYLKKAKAGSAEAEYGQLEIDKAMALTLKAPALIDNYKKAAIRKAAIMGCLFDITDEATLNWLNEQAQPFPFMVGGGGCHNCGS